MGPVINSICDTDGTLTAGARTGFATAANNLISAFAPGDEGAVVVWSPTDQLARDITGAHIPDKFAVLRSRRD